MDAASQYALAYSLTTTAGVRGLLSLAAVAVAAHMHLFHPPGMFSWLATPTAMWILIGVAAVEILADKVPLLDHVMHFTQVATKPAAAAILVGGSVHAQSHDVLVGLMVVGALNALGVHAAIASVRGASTITTGGAANPVVSVVEDAGAIGALILAFVLPMLAAALAILFTVALVLIGRSAYRRLRTARS